MNKAHAGHGEPSPPPPTPASEWVVAAIGLVIVAGALGFLAQQALAADPTPPDVVVAKLAVTRASSGHLVRIRASNQGGSAAAGLTLTGTLRQGTVEVEASEVTLDYLPAHSSKDAGLFFTRDPAGLVLTLRAEGYQEP